MLDCTLWCWIGGGGVSVTQAVVALVGGWVGR